MEGMQQPAAARLDEYDRAHPEVSIWRTWRGWWAWKQVPGADRFTGELAHADTAGGLLGKLGG